MSNGEAWAQLEASLRQRELNFDASLKQAKRKIMAEMVASGRLQSGMTLRMLAEALETNLLQFCTEAISHAQMWRSVEGIEEDKLRTRVVEFLRNIVAAYPEADYVSYGGKLDGSAGRAVQGLVESAKTKAGIEIGNFAFGVGESFSPQTTNVLNAHTIIGGVQQGTLGSTQSNTVEISYHDLSEAIEKLATELVARGLGGVAHDIQADVETIKAQLKKPEPNRGILRESAKSMRTIIEGAVGGAIATTMSPQFNSAMAMLTSFAGS